MRFKQIAIVCSFTVVLLYQQVCHIQTNVSLYLGIPDQIVFSRVLTYRQSLSTNLSIRGVRSSDNDFTLSFRLKYFKHISFYPFKSIFHSFIVVMKADIKKC